MPPASDAQDHVRTALAEVSQRLAEAADADARRWVLEQARAAVADEVLDLLDMLGRQDDLVRYSRIKPLTDRVDQLTHLVRQERESLRHEAAATGATEHLRYCEGILTGFETAIAE